MDNRAMDKEESWTNGCPPQQNGKPAPSAQAQAGPSRNGGSPPLSPVAPAGPPQPSPQQNGQASAAADLRQYERQFAAAVNGVEELVREMPEQMRGALDGLLDERMRNVLLEMECRLESSLEQFVKDSEARQVEFLSQRMGLSRGAEASGASGGPPAAQASPRPSPRPSSSAAGAEDGMLEDGLPREQLVAAARRGDWSKVHFFLECSVHPDAQDSLGNTALHYAVEKGRLDMVMECLRRGAITNLQNNMGSTPLHLAAVYDITGDFASALLGASACTDIEDAKGRTPLQVAGTCGTLATVIVLQRAVADLARTAAGRWCAP